MKPVTTPIFRRAALGAAVAATALGAFFAGTAVADQPRMRSALSELRLARRDLNAASPDKGGHRAEAIRLVNEAIRHVEMGVRFDRRH
jgi:hypothetical protein